MNIQRDTNVTHAIHKLFWRGMTQRPWQFLSVYLTHVPSYFIFNIFVPLQVAYGVQAILANQTGALHREAYLVLAVSVFGTILYGVGMWTNHRVNTDGAIYIQRQVFKNYLEQDYDFFSNSFIGSLGGDAVALRSAFQRYHFVASAYIPRQAVIVIAGIIVLLTKSVVLGLFTAACVLFVIGVTIVVSKFRLKYRREVSAASSILSGKIGDPLSQGQAVKSFAQEAHEQAALDKPLAVWRRAQLKIFDTSIPATMLRHFLLGAMMTLLLIVSARLYNEHAIGVAIVLLVQLYVVRIVISSVEIADVIKEYEDFMGHAYEPVATMLIEARVVDAIVTKPLPTSSDNAIVFKAVDYKYPEAAVKTSALKDFNLTIKTGEKVGLVGYSGGGKTTITKLLLRFMDVSKGHILVNGIDIRDVSQADLRQAIAYVPQEPLLFHRTIKDNIAYANPTASDKDIAKAAKTAYVDTFVKSLPEKYRSMVGERGIKLSGGQRQRIAIARALLKNAPILVLDEATSALDSQSEQYIQQALWQLMEGKTAIVIAHRLSTIQHMDRIVVVDKGKIAQIGTHAELLKDKKGAYATLWQHQSGGYVDEKSSS